MTMYVVLYASIDVLLGGSFLIEYPLIFILALYIFMASLILKSIKMFGLQLLLFILMLTLTNPAVDIILVATEVLIGGYLLYRLKRAIDFNYLLVMEKTHHMPRKITRDHNGSVSSFL